MHFMLGTQCTNGKEQEEDLMYMNNTVVGKARLARNSLDDD